MSEEALQLSGIQHFLFCRRQWALIAIEQQWQDNSLTVSGTLMHENAHDEFKSERRGKIIITRGMRIRSEKLRISGQCDVLEFHQVPQGITLFGWEGQWLPFPVEYKHGEQKTGDFDKAQLCAQAMCLEEMLCCPIFEGALFYGKEKHRLKVTFDKELRNAVINAVQEMHELFNRSYTTIVKKSKNCSSCSLKEICLPVIATKKDVQEYMEEKISENY